MNVNRFLSQQTQQVIHGHLLVQRLHLTGRKQGLKFFCQKIEKSLVQLGFHTSQFIIRDSQRLGHLFLRLPLIPFGAQETQKLQFLGGQLRKNIQRNIFQVFQSHILLWV